MTDLKSHYLHFGFIHIRFQADNDLQVKNGQLLQNSDFPWSILNTFINPNLILPMSK